MPDCDTKTPNYVKLAPVKNLSKKYGKMLKCPLGIDFAYYYKIYNIIIRTKTYLLKIAKKENVFHRVHNLIYAMLQGIEKKIYIGVTIYIELRIKDKIDNLNADEMYRYMNILKAEISRNNFEMSIIFTNTIDRAFEEFILHN